MILRWLNTLGARIALLLVVSLVLSEIVSLLIFVGRHDDGRTHELAVAFFRELVGLESVANRTSGPDLQKAVRGASRAEYGYWIAPAPVLGANARKLAEGSPAAPAAWSQIISSDKRAKWFPDVRPFWMRYRLQDVGPPGAAGGPGGQGQGAQGQSGPAQGGPSPGPQGPGQQGIGAQASLISTGPDQTPQGARIPPLPGPQGPGMQAPGMQAPGEGPPGPGLEPGPGMQPGLGPRGPGAGGSGPPPHQNKQYDFGEETTLEPYAPRESAPVMWRVSLQLADGQWLNGEYRQQNGLPPWAEVVLQENVLSLAIMLMAVMLTAGFATYRLRLLANAADKVGRGETLEPIPESGTGEVRHLTRSFNTMSLRLRRFIEARTQMLGAISHDLRTPITGLRLRAELVDDDENRERMLAIIDELHHLTEATLALARDDSFTEVTDKVDVSSLIEAICDDLTDVGIDVSCNVARGVSLNCRPYSLRRAIRNLAENGAKYGNRSRIHLNQEEQAVKIIVDDDGPGIPNDQLERVLLPFVRLESSRSRATGGAGLGLAITRSIVLNHGGDLELKNRAEGGLRATITLPVAA